MLSLLVLLSSAGVVHAQSTFIAGNIYAGASQGRQPVYAPNVLTPPVSDATVMVQNQHSGGAHIAYATVYGNLWAAEVPCPGDYVVMISALGYDSTSREFTLAQSDCGAFNFQDAYLPPLPLPSANLLVFAFYDNMVNGEPDLPDDEPLDGVTFTVSDPSGNVLATGVTGTQSTIVTPSGLVIYDTRGLYYFTDLPPGEVIVTSDPSRVHEAPNPRHNWNASTEFYLTYSEEGGRAWEVNLYPGDDGTEAGGFMIWHGYVEKLGQISAGNLSERFPAGTDLAAAGSIRGFLLDADGNDPAEPMPPELASVGVSANDRVPDGLVILFTDDETVPVHPVATTEADPVTGEYAFTNLPPGRYKMMAYDTPIDYVWVQRQIVIGPNEHIVGSGDPTQLNPADMFIPRFYARCQGYVYDAATGLPMANQEVRIRYKSGSVQQVATTDANGWYNFDDLPEIEVLGHVDVKLPPGYRGARRDQDFSYAVGACSSSGEYCRDNAQCPSGETCNPSVTTVTHNAMNRYLQWYTANYRADLYLEPISAGEGD
ncbi:MAG: hypothetical protein ACE5D3_08340, partial [Candidatus Binatia bacterium]